MTTIPIKPTSSKASSADLPEKADNAESNKPKRERGMPMIGAAPVSSYNRIILRIAFLSPDLQRDILAGHQPPSLNLETLQKMDIPLCWERQREALGWPASD